MIALQLWHRDCGPCEPPASAQVSPLRSESCVAPTITAVRELRWRHVECWFFACACVPGLDGIIEVALLCYGRFSARPGSNQAMAVTLDACPCSPISVVGTTACLLPFLLDPTATLAWHPPGLIKHQLLSSLAASLLGMICAGYAPVCRGIG